MSLNCIYIYLYLYEILSLFSLYITRLTEISIVSPLFSFLNVSKFQKIKKKKALISKVKSIEGCCLIDRGASVVIQGRRDFIRKRIADRIRRFGSATSRILEPLNLERPE